MPLILGGPGVPAGLVVQGSVTLADLAPTLLEAVGAEEDARVAGRSFWGELPRGRVDAREALLENPAIHRQFGWAELAGLRADGWNTNGTVEEVRTRLAVLDAHCADVGRERSEIEMTVSFPILLRDSRAKAEAAWTGVLSHNGMTSAGDVPHLLASPSEVADAIRPYVDLGFRTIIVRLPAPHDREKIDRIGEVGVLLDGA